MDGKNPPIRIWRWEDAPPEFQQPFNGVAGEFDWIGFIPVIYRDAPLALGRYARWVLGNGDILIAFGGL